MKEKGINIEEIDETQELIDGSSSDASENE